MYVVFYTLCTCMYLHYYSAGMPQSEAADTFSKPNVLVTDSRPGAESPAPVCARMYCVCRCQYSHAMITFNHSSSEITNPTTKIPEAGTRLPKMAGKTASVSSTTVCTRRAETVANTNFLPSCMQTSAYLLRNANKQI